MNAPLPVGAGAMLARLVSLGRRCGLEPEAVLLHVLDGAPLPDATDTEFRGDMIERALGDITGAVEASPEFARKGERAVYLYGTTALSNPAIGRQIGSTPQTVSWFVRQARDRGDALVLAGDRMRGRRERSTVQDEAPGKPVERDLQDSAPGPEDDADGLVFRIPELDPNATPAEQERLDDLNEQRQTRLEEEVAREAPSPPAVPVASLSKNEAAVELWAKTDLSYVDIASEIGSTSGSVYERIRQAKKKGDPRWSEGFARRDARKSPQPDEASGGGEHEVAQHHKQDATLAAAGEPAGETRQGDDPVARSNSPEGAQERPGSRVQVPPGTSVAFEGAPVAQSGRAGQSGDPGSNPGEEASPPRSSADRAPAISPEGASDVAGEPEAIPPASEPAGSPAPPPDPTPVEKGTVRRASGSAVRPARPGPDPEPTETTPQLPDDQVVAINAGWIVGPAGTIKGFPLINAVLQVLAAGRLTAVGTIAERAGARSAAAVQAMLGQWRVDLEKVGVEIVHFGDDIRLRRAGAL